LLFFEPTAAVKKISDFHMFRAFRSPNYTLYFTGGVAADRYDQYKIIRITQITSMIQAVLLAILLYTGHTVVWDILALSVILGIINAFDVPARQALINDVVADPADLPNALSLTTATAPSSARSSWPRVSREHN
jgi:MFS family permease